MSLAVVIITKNEEKNIVQCLSSIESFCDEMIVLDSYSTDKTLEYVSNFSKTKVYQREFDDYIAQKNYANSLVHSDYILSLDADEYADVSLQRFIQSSEYSKYDAVKFLRINHIGGYAIKHGIWKRDIKIRLWKRGKGHWAGSIPHEHLALDSDANVLLSAARLHHNAYSTCIEMAEKADKYAKLAAQSYKTKSWIFLLKSLIVNPIFKFIKGYFFLQGFRDGYFGWYLAKVSLLETFNKYFYAMNFKFHNK